MSAGAWRKNGKSRSLRGKAGRFGRSVARPLGFRKEEASFSHLLKKASEAKRTLAGDKRVGEEVITSSQDEHVAVKGREYLKE